MWRIAVVIVLVAIGIYVAVNAIITTEPERVEAEVERLLEVARRGGDEAVEEILLAFADDYRGEGTFSMTRIESGLRQWVAKGRITKLTTGNYQALWIGEEIIVPILSIQATTRHGAFNPILRVTFAPRDGEWRIVNVGRVRFER